MRSCMTNLFEAACAEAVPPLQSFGHFELLDVSKACRLTGFTFIAPGEDPVRKRNIHSASTRVLSGLYTDLGLNTGAPQSPHVLTCQNCCINISTAQALFLGLGCIYSGRGAVSAGHRQHWHATHYLLSSLQQVSGCLGKFDHRFVTQECQLLHARSLAKAAQLPVVHGVCATRFNLICSYLAKGVPSNQRAKSLFALFIDIVLSTISIAACLLQILTPENKSHVH